MKEKLRKCYQQIRQQITADDRYRYSQEANAHLLASHYWSESSTIMAYLAMPQELSLDTLFVNGWQNHKQMVIPICQPTDHSLDLALLGSFEHLIPGTFAIRELPAESRELVPVEQIDLCLVPGIAFDYYGNRMGFGAGYYDRFLPTLKPSALKIGVAFSATISPTILPVEIHDVPMDFILTEQGLWPVKKL